MLYEIERLGVGIEPAEISGSCTERIYVFADIGLCSDELFRKAYSLISEARRNRVDRYVFRSDKLLSCLAEILLMYGLYELYSVQGPVEVLTNKYGKPYLKDYPHINFNLSHCKEGVICGFSQKAIGVDIQDVIRFDEALAEFICSSEEFDEIGKCTNKAEELTKTWAIKEAYLKWKGIGIAHGVKAVESYSVIHSNELYFYLYTNEKYAAAVCASNKIDSFVKLSVEDLEWVIAKLSQAGFNDFF